MVESALTIHVNALKDGLVAPVNKVSIYNLQTI